MLRVCLRLLQYFKILTSATDVSRCSTTRQRASMTASMLFEKERTLNARAAPDPAQIDRPFHLDAAGSSCHAHQSMEGSGQYIIPMTIRPTLDVPRMKEYNRKVTREVLKRECADESASLLSILPVTHFGNPLRKTYCDLRKRMAD